MRFLIFSGSARKGNYTQHVAHFVQQVAMATGHQIDLVSPESLGLSFDDEGEQAKPNYPDLTEKITAADGYIIISPEYNHGYPGSLKYLLDLHLKEYLHKPVALTGVSKGPWGGTRVIEALLHPVREYGMVATFNDLNVTMVQDEIENGTFKDPEKWKTRVLRMLEELVWMATVLKVGREQK